LKQNSIKQTSEYCLKGKIIAGVDEAGRGPLAGPVFAGAVILNPHAPIEGLADSKKISAKERERLFLLIRKHCLAWSFAYASVKAIDHLNILQATFLAMQNAVRRLKVLPQHILVDGNVCPAFMCQEQHISAHSIIRGDASEPAISAASIVAKVLRDQWMRYLDKKYPQYGFAKHKGYGTAQHIEALEKHGQQPGVHRRSFVLKKIFIPQALPRDENSSQI
jgi:ribonuclease HII